MRVLRNVIWHVNYGNVATQIKNEDHWADIGDTLRKDRHVFGWHLGRSH